MSGIRWIGLVAFVVLALACAAPAEPESSSPRLNRAEAAQVVAKSPALASTPTLPSASTDIPSATPSPTVIPSVSPTPIARPQLVPVPAIEQRPQTPETIIDPASVLRSRRENLRARAEADAAIWNEQEWERLYELIIARAPEFRETCTLQEFSAQMTFFGEVIRAFGQAEADTRIELRVIDVQVDGENGEVYTDWFFDGLSFNEHLAQRFEGSEVAEEPNKQAWVFVDGRWEERLEDNWDPSEGCPKLDFQQ